MHALVFGPGFSGKRIVRLLEMAGMRVTAIGRGDTDLANAELHTADLIVSTAPPQDGGDPVLARHDRAITASGAKLVYLSSTGFYGDTQGAWIDEGGLPNGRRPDRIVADQAWLSRGACVLRLPGIYGPGRSVVDRLQAGRAPCIDLPGQVFSRIHVDDIATAVLAATRYAGAGAFNIADDHPCAQAELIEWTAARLGLPPPPRQTLAEADLSPMARAFYDENRRIANGKAKRLLGWRPLYPDYRAGLRALIATTRPSITSTPPPIAVGVQR